MVVNGVAAVVGGRQSRSHFSPTPRHPQALSTALALSAAELQSGACTLKQPPHRQKKKKKTSRPLRPGAAVSHQAPTPTLPPFL